MLNNPCLLGSFNAKYCPHVSGCRVVVTLPDGSNVFELTGDGQSIQISVPDSEDENKLWVVSFVKIRHFNEVFFFVICE